MNFIALSSRSDAPSWSLHSRRSRQDIPGGWTATPSRRPESGGQACALERSDAAIGIGAQLGGEGVQGLERAFDRGAIGGGLRSEETNPRPGDIEGAKS